MRNALRSFRASIEIRGEIHLPALLIPFGDANAVTSILGVVPEALGASLGLPGHTFGQLLAALRPPGAPQIELGPSFGCPKAVPNTSGGVPKTILDAQDGSRSIVRRFWDDLAWISDDF